MRALSPRRQSTTLPATLAGSSVLGLHSATSVAGTPARPAPAASTSGVSGSAFVTEAPLIVNVSLAPLTVTVAVKDRASELAATVVSHGTEAGEPTVPAPGPSLPAELATKTPASAALRKAIESSPITVDVGLPTE
jgi:hypothetical protein